MSITPITTGISDRIDMQPHKFSRPMTPRKAAEYLGLDEKTVTRWARCGYLPAHPLGEGKRKFWRFLEPELEEWLAAKTNG